MLAMKFKETRKLKSHGEYESLRSPLCDEEINLSHTKINYKDYVNEIFAGLSWLG